MNKVNSIQDYQDTSDTQVNCIPAKIKEINPLYDVCLLEIPQKHSQHSHFHQQILFMLVKTSLCSVIHIVITEEWY